MEQVQLKIAGWLGEQHRDYVDQQLKKLADAGAADVVDHVGTVDREGKLDFLRQIDVLSVPTVYREPKG